MFCLQTQCATSYKQDMLEQEMLLTHPRTTIFKLAHCGNALTGGGESRPLSLHDDAYHRRNE